MRGKYARLRINIYKDIARQIDNRVVLDRIIASRRTLSRPRFVLRIYGCLSKRSPRTIDARSQRLISEYTDQ